MTAPEPDATPRAAGAVTPREWILAWLGGGLFVSGLAGFAGLMALFAGWRRTLHWIDATSLAVTLVGAGLFCQPRPGSMRTTFAMLAHQMGFAVWVTVGLVMVRLARIDLEDALLGTIAATLVITPIVLVSALAAIQGTGASTLRTTTVLTSAVWIAANVVHPHIGIGLFPDSSIERGRVLALDLAVVGALFMAIERVPSHRRRLGMVVVAALLTSELLLVVGVRRQESSAKMMNFVVTLSYLTCAQMLAAIPPTLLIRTPVAAARPVPTAGPSPAP